jgi:hypothetical protein
MVEEKQSEWNIVETDMAMWTEGEDSVDGFERVNQYCILETLGKGQRKHKYMKIILLHIICRQFWYCEKSFT